MKIWKAAVLFYLGGAVYLTLEFLCRGRSHGSMFILGGVCFLLLGQVGKLRLPAAVKGLLGAAMITALELLTGYLVNRDYLVWDYRGMAGNFRGQICPAFTLLWIPVSLAGMALYRAVEPRL